MATGSSFQLDFPPVLRACFGDVRVHVCSQPSFSKIQVNLSWWFSCMVTGGSKCERSYTELHVALRDRENKRGRNWMSVEKRKACVKVVTRPNSMLHTAYLVWIMICPSVLMTKEKQKKKTLEFFFFLIKIFGPNPVDAFCCRVATCFPVLKGLKTH